MKRLNAESVNNVGCSELCASSWYQLPRALLPCVPVVFILSVVLDVVVNSFEVRKHRKHVMRLLVLVLERAEQRAEATCLQHLAVVAETD